MREVSVITRNLMPGPGFKRKFRVTWLVAALLGYLLGAFTASYVPLVLNTIRSAPSRVLAHGLHIQKQEQNAVIENPQVSKPSGQQSRSSEQIQVEGSLSGSTDSGRNGEVGDLVIVEEVGNPPAKQEDDDAPQLAQASVGSSCNLFKGRWVPDPEGPLYRHDTCPVISKLQNCQANGRPDKGYESWKWQPTNCDLPRFDPHAFLDLMRGKTLAFVGDSLARNHMESLMCAFMQAAQPKDRGNKKMQRWYFPTHSLTIIRIWSAWLVQLTSEPLDVAPEGGIPQVHLDQADENFDTLPTIDVLVVSGSHWFGKTAAFVVDGEVVGGLLPQATPGRNSTVDYTAAFAIAMRTALHRLTSHPGYKGLTILRTYSPDHYTGGEWNSGGSCTGREAPTKDEKLHASVGTALMRQHQVEAYNEALQAGFTNLSKLRLMDVTTVLEYRADGHPGPYNGKYDPQM